MSEPIIIPMEDDLIHTNEHPICDDPTCPCHEYQIGDRVQIMVEFVDGWQHQGTVYNVSRGRYPYHVRADGETSGGAYTSAEIAPASLPLAPKECEQ
jgi:hypothetical protein